MATYGEIRARLAIVAPGLHLTVLDGFLNDRYTQILDRLDWRRIRKETVIQTVAVYETGTVALTNGLNTVTGTGTTFTSAMTGRLFRNVLDNAYYTFTYVSATSGTLDRVYEGETGTGLTYKIAQNRYTLPSDCKIIDGARLLDPPGELIKKSAAELDFMAPHRPTYGAPEFWAPSLDDSSDPPLGRIEFYPIPDEVTSIVVAYTAEQAALSSTSVTVLPWVRPAAMVEGTMADIRRLEKDPSLAASHEARFETLVADMIRTLAFERGPQQLAMAGRFTRHRRLRGLQ